MSSAAEPLQALESLRAGLNSGRLAHAYILIGPPRTEGRMVAEGVLSILLCEAADKPCGRCAGCVRVQRHTHPDVRWIEPQSRSRVIQVEQVRELVSALTQSAYAGGWKAGVLVQADRLNDSSANAFLKTLEEPTPHTLLLLLTDQPQWLLPTIHSRCQRISVAGGRREPPPWQQDVLAILAEDVDTLASAMLYASRLRGLIELQRDRLTREEDEGALPGAEEDKDARDARIASKVMEFRSEVLRLVQDWRRDVLLLTAGGEKRHLHFPQHLDALQRQASRCKYGESLQRLREVERMARRMQGNIPDLAVLETDGLRALLAQPGR